MFLALTCAVQALVKARGDGLGFDLGKAEFRFSGHNRNSACVLIDGRPQPRCALCCCTRDVQPLSMRNATAMKRGLCCLWHE